MEPLLLGMSAFIGGSCLLDTDGFLPLGILFDTEFKCDYMLLRIPSFSRLLTLIALTFFISVVSSHVLPELLL